MPRRLDTAKLIGLKYGQLTITGTTGFGKRGQGRVICLCSCGREHVCVWGNVKYGKTGRCKACRSAALKIQSYRHGLTKTPEYNCWKKMRDRCNNTKSKQYYDYGGRGIRVCDRWNESVLAFYQDMGPRPSPSHSIDRKDVNGNYEPSNCRWATTFEQGQNKRSTKQAIFRGAKCGTQVISRALKVRDRFVIECIHLGFSGDEIEEFLALRSCQYTLPYRTVGLKEISPKVAGS